MILTYAGVRYEEVCQVGQKHTLDDGLRESHTSAQGVNIYGPEMKLRFPRPAQHKPSYYSSVTYYLPQHQSLHEAQKAHLYCIILIRSIAEKKNSCQHKLSLGWFELTTQVDATQVFQLCRLHWSA